MQRSTDRILTTHVGSLPRPDDLLEMLNARMSGSRGDEAAFAARVRDAVGECVRRQVETGLDVITDGEVGKPSFVNYVNDRLGGFERNAAAPSGSPWGETREARSFPEFYEKAARSSTKASALAVHLACTGPIRYTGHNQIAADIENLKRAAEGLDYRELFLPSVSPSNVEEWQANLHYSSEEDYLFAIAEAMAEEYKAITDAGLIVQIDDPRLVTYYITRPDLSVEQCRQWARLRVEALNHALRGIPREKVRFHTCYGINMGPRVHDMELKDMIDIMLQVRAGGFSFEAANPRHEHEWKVWAEVDLPADTVLIPGVITNSSLVVEHPETIADRIERFAQAVGRENVLASADCGFATFAGSEEFHPSIVWAKLASLVEGAKVASRRLWR
ncbi:MAG: cobalamin-independent methionine synthase II family protein [Rhodobiaceae bacterium]|nr:cobalamin-independent methionine synthase II family protein [Rhodobiaceae bacterium]